MNNNRVITPRFVETIRPRTTRTEYPDAGCPGLYLIVQPSGSRSWAHRFVDQGKTRKVTLGSADVGENGLSLAGARAAVTAHRHRLEWSPGVAGVTGVTPKTDGGRDRIETAVASFLELHAFRKTRPSTARATEHMLNNIALPAWRGRTVGSITKRDVIDLVEEIAISGRGYLANRTLASLSKFFNWLIARDVLTFSPVSGVERPYKEEARERVLTDEEIRRIWIACEGEGPFGQALRSLILLGARRSEISEMSWAELSSDHSVWTLPRERSKNRRAHQVPLPSQAQEILSGVPHLLGCDFVFTTDGRTSITGWTKIKDRISTKAGLAADSWRIHDLRRTCASGMQRLGVSVPVIEKALNHVSGTFRGITGVYQRHDYASEIGVALQRWADHVERVVSGEPAKVVNLRQR